MRAWVSRRPLVAFVAFGVCAACGSGDPGGSGEATDTAAVSADRDPATGDFTPPSGNAPASTPVVPVLPGEGPPRDYRLLLVNTSDAEVRVFAQAAATRVVLDTVPPRDSTRVDIRVRAEEVSLEAEDPSGVLLVREVLVLSADTLNRWEISQGPPNAAIDPSPGPLVRQIRPGILGRNQPG